MTAAETESEPACDDAKRPAGCWPWALLISHGPALAMFLAIRGPHHLERLDEASHWERCLQPERYYVLFAPALVELAILSGSIDENSVRIGGSEDDLLIGLPAVLFLFWSRSVAWRWRHGDPSARWRLGLLAIWIHVVWCLVLLLPLICLMPVY